MSAGKHKYLIRFRDTLESCFRDVMRVLFDFLLLAKIQRSRARAEMRGDRVVVDLMVNMASVG
jgi:hypothetical protein